MRFLILALVLTGCEYTPDSIESQQTQQVQAQQVQYAIGQPIPTYDWSLERQLVIDLYNIRNFKVATYTVWRGDTSIIEGHCPSMGFGLPYDTSLTNPLMATSTDEYGRQHSYEGGSLTSIGQAEPNGIFASTNTSATWVFCVNGAVVEPHYVEAKVTGYPYQVEVLDDLHVRRASAKSVNIKIKDK